MKTYSKKIEEKLCPGCGETKPFAARNTYCSARCASDAQRTHDQDAFEDEQEEAFVYAPAPNKKVQAKKDRAGNKVVSSVSDPNQLENVLTKMFGSAIKQMVAELQGSLNPAKASVETYHPDSSNFEDGVTVMLSDVHFNIHHVLACASLIPFFDEHQPSLKRLVLAGDIFDAAALGRHTPKRRKKSHIDLGQEMEIGAPIINKWGSFFEEVYMLGGNHELDRLTRVLAVDQGVGIPEEPLEMQNLLDFYDINAKFIDRTRFDMGYEDGKVRLYHGTRYNRHTAATILQDNMYTNSGQGHSHRPQVFYEKSRVGFVNGHLMDVNKQHYMDDPNWTMGFTVIEHFDQGHQVNVYFVKVSPDGKFSFMGKVFTGKAIDLLSLK